MDTFDQEGGAGRPRYGQAVVCWGDDEAEARRTAHREWPNVAVPGQLAQDLATPEHFEQAVGMVSEDDVAAVVPCGPDVGRHVETVQEFDDAGFTHVYLQQVGPDQAGFLRFWERELRPALRERGLPDGGGPPGPRYDGRVLYQHHQGAHMGAFEEAKGKLKEAAGDLTDNAGLKREGQAQSEKGEAEREATEARTEAKAHEAEAAAREAEQRGAERLK